ncbi:cellulose biosynthesis protein BcsQ [Gluconacetobacter takamatsuzukensis]|uniref:Cellulose synthase operon protein YhjQ n=1 Tax=Gluconacetobacter takamatsuzukensis TaxID=1286190 RepID=A0A7W4PPE4_9PROT|nr:cellulose biosynthesis protein BcsQ [Gluconacetobacter takamatsuzukensis]MBB2205537.1 cellulose synthase operon protein YhjQ [Gluconacetobacter takamatsuzukensis]
MPLICCVSPKGGVGKSTVVANVAANLARLRSHRVVAVDLDPQNMLRLHMGVPLSENRGFIHLLGQPQYWYQIRHETPEGATILPYGGMDMAQSVEMSARVRQNPDLLAEPLRQIAADPRTLVIVDTEPGPSAMLHAILPRVDLLVTVLTADAASAALFSDIESGRTYGAAHSAPQCFIINQFDPMTRLGPVIARSLGAQMGRRLLGIVHRDEHMGEALAAQKPVAAYAPRSQATHDLGAISHRLVAMVGG